MPEILQFGNLSLEIKESPQEVVYKFSGDVDEHLNQKKIPRLKKPSIVFELAGITNFNSCGIREWIYLVQDLGKLGQLKFRQCSVTMIDQINMVPDSLGAGIIESFYAPYYCSCGGEINCLIKVNEAADFLANKMAPPYFCEKCGAKLEFDALEESYFLFTDTALPKAS